MLPNPFLPHTLVGRQAELEQVCQILQADGDLLIAGMPGSGRHVLVRTAAQQVGARVVEIDCLRTTNGARFLELLAEGILDAFSHAAELALIERWSLDKPLILEHGLTRRARLVWQDSDVKTPQAKSLRSKNLRSKSPTAEAITAEAMTAEPAEWSILEHLLSLPQAIAEALDCRVVIVFQNLPHLNSWDRSRQWEIYLQQEIQRQSRVSYVSLVTVPQDWGTEMPLSVLTLGPLTPAELEPWIVSQMASQGLAFAAEGHALTLFYSYVQGHLGGAIALARRMLTDHLLLVRSNSLSNSPSNSPSNSSSNSPSNSSSHGQPIPDTLILPHHIHRSTLALVEDLTITFESLILLLPPTQVRVLESLALDPTDSPHARDYIQKHQLSRGGALQGALAGLEQKGLVYGAKYGYRIAMPFLGFWLKHRLA